MKKLILSLAVLMSLFTQPASAWEFDYRDGVIATGVAVLAAGPAALAFPAFLLTAGATTQKYGEYIPFWNEL